MNTKSHCPSCGRVRPGDTRAEVCPHCELQGALELAADASEGRQLPLRVGDYDLLEEIGRGGMGVVFRARQLSLNRMVAVKLVLQGAFASPDALVRFQKEAQIAARLQHPHIIAIHEVGEFEGRPFFSMDYVEGQPLDERVRGQALPPRRAAQFLETLAEAVAYAHAQGVIHRDLKPSNVLVDGRDHPRIVDFGVAKRLEGEADLTQSGQVLGSPSYMAPEQARPVGGPSAVSPAVDVYALGAILYYLITGRPPFVSETASGLLVQLSEADPPAPRLTHPAVPRDLETICLKCLEKDPLRRYRSGSELAEDLRRFLQHQPIRARPVGRVEKLVRWYRRNPALASALVACGLMLVSGVTSLAWQWRRAEGEALAARRSLYAADMLLAHQAYGENNFGRVEQLLHRHDPTRGSRPAEDLRGWEWHALRHRIQTEELFALGSHSNTVSALLFAPDGRTLVSVSHYLFGNDIQIWDVPGRKRVTTLRPGRVGKGASTAFAADSRTLAVVEGPRLRLYQAPDFQLTRATEPLDRNIGAVAYSADGTLLAAVETQDTGPGGDDARLHLWDPETLERRDTLPTGSGRGLAISPDARFIAVMLRLAEAVTVWDRTSRSLVAELPGPGPFYRQGNLLFSPDGGKLAIVTGKMIRERGRVDVWSVPGFNKLRSVEMDQADVSGVAFSADSQRVYVAGTNQRIAVYDLASGQLLDSLVGHRDEVWCVATSPDGSLLASGSRDETIRIWSTARQASVDALPLPSSTRQVYLADDGTALAAISSNETVQVWSIANSRCLAQGAWPAGKVYGWSNNEWVQVAVGSQGAGLVIGTGTHKDLEGTPPALRLWEIPSLREGREFQGLHTWACGLALSSDGRQLAAAGFFGEGRAIVWDVESGDVVQVVPGLPGRSGLVKFSPRGTFLAVRLDRDWTWGWEVSLWNVRDADLVGVLTKPNHRIIDLAFSPDELHLATAGDDAVMGVWDVRTGTLEHTLSGTLTSFTSVAWSPDGTRLVGGGRDGTLTLWETRGYQVVGSIAAHPDRVLDVAFLENGNTLVSVGLDALRFWRASL